MSTQKRLLPKMKTNIISKLSKNTLNPYMEFSIYMGFLLIFYIGAFALLPLLLYSKSLVLIILLGILTIFPVLGLINRLNGYKWDELILLTGTIAGFICFIFISAIIIQGHPATLSEFIIFILFGIGNAMLWPFFLSAPLNAKKNIVPWFIFSLLPVISVVLLIIFYSGAQNKI